MRQVPSAGRQWVRPGRSAWVDYYWYKPGHNTPARKHTYVRKVQFGKVAYIVASGFYSRDEEIKTSQIQKTSRNTIHKEKTQ